MPIPLASLDLIDASEIVDARMRPLCVLTNALASAQNLTRKTLGLLLKGQGHILVTLKDGFIPELPLYILPAGKSAEEEAEKILHSTFTTRVSKWTLLLRCITNIPHPCALHLLYATLPLATLKRMAREKSSLLLVDEDELSGLLLQVEEETLLKDLLKREDVQNVLGFMR